MPHIHIDYSPNVLGRIDMAEFCKILRDAALATQILPLAGLRIRATPCSHFVIADGSPDHAYIDISLRLREGRSAQAKAAATELIFAAAERFCSDALENSSLMLSFEMRDIDAALSPKTSSIRRYLAGDHS